jgi:hypothetical protein
VQIEPAATRTLIELYLGTVAIAAVIILFAVIWLRGADRRQNRRLARAAAVWSDGPTTTARIGRSPGRAPRASRRPTWQGVSAQRG